MNNDVHFEPNKPDFKKLVLLSIQQLTNFPYIEADFDAITNYQLLCKVVEYLNQVIANNNEQNETILGLYNAYLELQNYVNNYFDNLDVQEEINNKLDEMASDGTLQEIIYEYINSNVFFVFDTVADMKSSTNLINGNYAETLGYFTINDGGKSKYIIYDDEPVSGYYETLDNGKYALLLIGEELRPEQVGAKGDGTTDDSVAFATAVGLVKNTNKVLKIVKNYYITTPIVLSENDRLTMAGDPKSVWKDNTNQITIGNNDLFKGAKLIDFTETKVGLDLYNINFTSTSGSKGTLFKGLLINGAVWEKCKFQSVYAVIEGGFNFVSTIKNCESINIRNFFISDYIFSTPTDMKDLRNGTTLIGDVTVYNTNCADSPNLFDSCYFNGYNPVSAYTSLDMPCFHLLHYSDSEVCGNDCFLDFWYAIEETFRASGTSNNFSWKNCVFQRSIYFFDFHNDYPAINGFEFIGNELVTFGSDQNIVTDKANYATAKLTSDKIMLRRSNITGNYYASDKYKIIINKSSSNAITRDNRFNNIIECPVIPDSTTQWYEDTSVKESRYEELDNQIYEVDSLPDVITITAGTNNNYGLYFHGRKFVFKINDDYYYKTLVRISSTQMKFI